MELIEAGQKSFLKFGKLCRPNLLHFSTTRKGWEGNGPARFTGDQEQTYLPYRKELARSLGIRLQQLVFPRQVHSDHIVRIDEPLKAPDVPDTDALVTNCPGICICVQTADCVPILLYDPRQKVVAAVHAGWRGTVSKIVSRTIHLMQLQFDSEPDDLIAGIGPSIHQHVYEVGPEVIQSVREQFSNYRVLLKPSETAGKGFLDLWAANQSLMLDAGVKEENIEMMGLCSWSHASLFYSARREGALTGRMATGIMLK